MNKYQKCFMRQKLDGLACIIGSILVAYFTGGDSLAIPIILVPLGLYFVFTRELVLHTNGLFEEEESEEF